MKVQLLDFLAIPTWIPALVDEFIKQIMHNQCCQEIPKNTQSVQVFRSNVKGTVSN